MPFEGFPFFPPIDSYTTYFILSFLRGILHDHNVSAYIQGQVVQCTNLAEPDNRLCPLGERTNENGYVGIFWPRNLFDVHFGLSIIYSILRKSLSWKIIQ